MSPETQDWFEFGPFHLDPAQQQLLDQGKPVPLTPKAFATLVVLVRNHGRLVTKEELLQTVWPDAFVEESTLAQNVFRLRRLLGDDGADFHYIETIPKRGYRFIAQVTQPEEEQGPRIATGNTQPLLAPEIPHSNLIVFDRSAPKSSVHLWRRILISSLIAITAVAVFTF